MTYYAKQVPAEFTESPFSYMEPELFLDEYVIVGNKNYTEYTTTKWDVLHEYLTDIENEITADPAEQIELIKYYYPGLDSKTALQIAGIIINELEKPGKEQDYFCKLYSIIVGKKYKYRQICGLCQSDWNYIYYPAETDEKTINNIETEYFNTGTEYMIHDEEYTPKSPDDITGYCVYIHEITPEKVRAELAENIGCKPEDIKIYDISGEHHYTKYDYMEV